MLDFDVLLESLGTLGTYQILVFAALVYFGIPSGLNAIAPVFLSYTPEYRCKMYPFDDESLYPDLSSDTIMNMTTPLDSAGDPVDACLRYGYNLTECEVEGGTACVNKSAGTVECADYYYDDTLFTETVVTEFDLVCDRRSLDSLGSSMYMLGFLIGAVVAGYVSDRFGRKLTTVVCAYAMLLLMLAVAYCRSVELYIVSRFFLAVFAMGCNIAIFSHLMEIVGNRWRTLVGIGYQISFAVGYMLWSGIAYLYRDWHQMQLGALVVSAPIAIIVLIVPESPRWLFTNGHDKKGKKVVSTMARLNKVEIPDSLWSEAGKAAEEKGNDNVVNYSTIDLFRHPGLRILTLKVGFNWAVNSMVYYGISLNAGSLAGDIFLNNVYAGVLEIASYVICILIMDYVGRRLLLTITLTGAGVALLASTVVNEYAGTDQTLIMVVVVFAFIGKALVSGSFAVIYNFTGELYPTVIRSNGLGFGSMCARVGSILSPFIIGIQDYVSWLPNTIFGVFAIVGGLLSLTFRDTTGRDIMETIEEAELFYANKENSTRKKMNDLSTEGCDNIAIEVDDEKISTAL